MSKKSKMMKRAAAKAAKPKDNESNQKSALGIKKEEKKEVKKAALLKALAEKSVTVVKPPTIAGGDTSGKKKRKRRNKKKKDREASNVQPNKEQQVAKDASLLSSENTSGETLKPLAQQQPKLSSNDVPSGKNKKKRKRHKRNKSNSAAEQPAAVQQKEIDGKSAEQQKKAPTEQLKSSQTKDVVPNDQPVWTEVGSKKRKRRNRKPNSHLFSDSTESSAGQKSAKRAKLSPETSSKKTREASHDTVVMPSARSWLLSSNNETDSDINQSNDDKEDLDTSEDDLDEEPDGVGEDSNDESSEGKSSDEKSDEMKDNVTEDDFSIADKEACYAEESKISGSSIVEDDEEIDNPESNNSDSEGEESDEEVDGHSEFENLGSSEDVDAEEAVDNDPSKNSSATNEDLSDLKVAHESHVKADKDAENVNNLKDISSGSDNVGKKVDDTRGIRRSSPSLDSSESAEISDADDDDAGTDLSEIPIKMVKGESKKAEKAEKASTVQSASTHWAKKKFSLSNKAQILKEIKERTVDFDSRCLYISPIPADCTFDTIKKFIPKIKTCQFFTRPNSDKLRTYAFVELADAETASKERLSILGRLFAGNSVRVESRTAQQTYSASTVGDIDFSRIVVTGIVPTVNQSDLKAIFPTAESVRLPMLKNFNLGHATVTFVSDAVALDAFSQCHHYPLKGHPICVNFALKLGGNKSAAPGAVDTSKSSKKTTEVPATVESTQPAPERVGKVLIQQMKEDSGESDKNLKSTKKKLDAKLEKGGFGLTELIKNSKKKVGSENEEEDDEEDEGDDNEDDKEDVDKSKDNSDDVDDDEDDGNGDESDYDNDDSDDDDNASEAESNDDEDEDEDNVEASDDGDDSEGEEMEEAALEEALKAHKASTKALKSPGAKRNWKAPANTKAGKKRPAGSMPKVLPVPPSKRMK